MTCDLRPASSLPSSRTLPVRGLMLAYTTNPYGLVAIQVLDGISASVLGVMVPLIVSDLTRGTGRFNLALGAVGIANMWAAIFADVGVMIIAVLNAIRALNVKKL